VCPIDDGRSNRNRFVVPLLITSLKRAAVYLVCPATFGKMWLFPAPGRKSTQIQPIAKRRAGLNWTIIL
jgi:hypothetical protein